MKIKCKVCRKETEIDELNHTSGDKIIVECQRCGNEMEATIPYPDEDVTEKPHVRVVNQETDIINPRFMSSSDYITREDLNSIWYSAQKATNHSTSAKESDGKASEKRLQEPTSLKSETYDTNDNVDTLKHRLSTPNSSASRNSSIIKKAITPETNLSPWKILIFILLAIAIIVGGCLWFGNINSGEDSPVHEKATEVMESEVTEVIEEDPFYEILDHPERELSWSDIKDFDKAQLRILRNAYFARHGYIFNDKELTKFFSQFTWYRPYTKDVIHSFSQIEKNNVELIRGYEAQ